MRLKYKFINLIILIIISFLLNSCLFESGLVETLLGKNLNKDSDLVDASIHTKYYLYLGDNLTDNSIYIYKIDMSTGFLSDMTTCANPTGQTTFIAVDPLNKYLYAASSNNNKIQVFGVNKPDGTINPINSFNLGFSPDKQFFVSPNGLYLFGISAANNRLYNCEVNTTTGLLINVNSTNSNIDMPKDLAIKPSGDFLFVISYNNSSLSCFDISNDPINLGIYNSNFFSYGQAIAVHPKLNYLYVSNYMLKTIQPYFIDQYSGILTVNGAALSTGNFAISIVIDPSGKYLYCANYMDNTISGYEINQADGLLTPLSGSPYNPNGGHSRVTYLAIDPTGKYLYAPMNGGTSYYIDGFSIGVNGNLTLLSNYWPHSADNPSNCVVIGIQQ